MASSIKSIYLKLYNSTFAALWLTLLLRIVVTGSLDSYTQTYGTVGNFVTWIQTAALLEVVHAATGLVRAPLIPTFIQTVAKNLVLWTIVRPFPEIALSPAYTIMLVMWSLGEVIRYGYFALMLVGILPKLVIWLRYSAFIFIYPIGILAEMWLVYRALMLSDSAVLTGIMCGELGLYFPGSFFLYSYMLKQRSKTLRSKSI